MTEVNGWVPALVLGVASLPFAGIAYVIQTYGGPISFFGMVPLLLALLLMMGACAFATLGTVDTLKASLFDTIGDSNE